MNLIRDNMAPLMFAGMIVSMLSGHPGRGPPCSSGGGARSCACYTHAPPPPRHTMGVIAASGTITQLIPPSLVLIVLADQLGRSVGDMYAGAIGPSIIQLALFCIW